MRKLRRNSGYCFVTHGSDATLPPAGSALRQSGCCFCNVILDGNCAVDSSRRVPGASLMTREDQRFMYVGSKRSGLVHKALGNRPGGHCSLARRNASRNGEPTMAPGRQTSEERDRPARADTPAERSTRPWSCELVNFVAGPSSSTLGCPVENLKVRTRPVSDIKALC
jgi:hypothetical protein